MSFIKAYVHFVWSTKNREPYLRTEELRKQVWQHMFNYSKEKGIFINFINGHQDHCHCLVSMGVNQTMEEVVRVIKGESSFWINKNKLTGSKFQWQKGYFAVSVSESMLDRVRMYIEKQEEHHRHRTFQEEYDELMKKYKFQVKQD